MQVHNAYKCQRAQVIKIPPLYRGA